MLYVITIYKFFSSLIYMLAIYLATSSRPDAEGNNSKEIAHPSPK